jgi:fluoride exporter
VPRTSPRTVLGHPWPVLAAVSAGGALGALARAGLSRAFPPPPGAFAWVTFAINVSGCLLIGGLMVLVTQLWTGRRLVRPFLGVGVLGGYTTFSGYVVDAERTLAAGGTGAALAYLVLTPVAAVTAAWLGSRLTRRLIRPATPPRRHPDPSDRTGER